MEVCSGEGLWGQGAPHQTQFLLHEPPGGPAQTHLGPSQGHSPPWGHPPIPSASSQQGVRGNTILAEEPADTPGLQGAPGRAGVGGISATFVSCHTQETERDLPWVTTQRPHGAESCPTLRPSDGPGSTRLGQGGQGRERSLLRQKRAH